MLQPDFIAAYTTGGQTYLVPANEGDARDREAYSEKARIRNRGFRHDHRLQSRLASRRPRGQLHLQLPVLHGRRPHGQDRRGEDSLR